MPAADSKTNSPFPIRQHPAFPTGAGPVPIGCRQCGPDPRLDGPQQSGGYRVGREGHGPPRCPLLLLLPRTSPWRPGPFTSSRRGSRSKPVVGSSPLRRLTIQGVQNCTNRSSTAGSWTHVDAELVQTEQGEHMQGHVVAAADLIRQKRTLPNRRRTLLVALRRKWEPFRCPKHRYALSGPDVTPSPRVASSTRFLCSIVSGVRTLEARRRCH